MGPVDRRSIVHPLGRAMPPLRHRGRPAASIARQGATDSTGQRLDLPPPPQAPRPYRRLDAAHASTVPGASASTRATSSSRARLDQRRGGLDQAGTRRHQAHRPSRVPAPRSHRPSRRPRAILPSSRPRRPRRPTLAGASTPAPAPPPQLDARARPQGGGGGPAATGAPHVCRATHTLAPIFEHRGGQNWVNETRSRCQASTPSPEASRAPRTPLRHPWWHLRAPGSRPRIPPHGETANRTQFGQPRAARRPISRRDACTLHFALLPLALPPPDNPLPSAQEGARGAQRRSSGPIRGVCRAHTHDSAEILCTHYKVESK